MTTSLLARSTPACSLRGEHAWIHVHHCRVQLRHAGVDEHARVGMVDEVDVDRHALALGEQLGHEDRRDRQRRGSLPAPSPCRGPGSRIAHGSCDCSGAVPEPLVRGLAMLPRLPRCRHAGGRGCSHHDVVTARKSSVAERTAGDTRRGVPSASERTGTGSAVRARSSGAGDRDRCVARAGGALRRDTRKRRGRLRLRQRGQHVAVEVGVRPG
jgi:hypothetical protein